MTAALSALFLIPGCQGGLETAHIGQEPLKAVVKVENNVHAVQTWGANGVRADVLIHIDASDDLRIFPDNFYENIVNAAGHVKRKKVGILDRISKYIESGGTLNVGFEAGLYKRIIWVMPSLRPIGEDPDAFKQILILRRGYTADDLVGLTADGTYLSGELAGVPVTITTLEDLGEVPGSCIIDIDLAYFLGQKSLDPSYQPGTEAVIEFLDSLAARNINASMATINLCTLGGLCPIDMRYFGDFIVEALANPSWLKDPPEKWKWMIEAENLMFEGKYLEADSRYETLITRYPYSSGLYFSQAMVRGFAGNAQGCRESLIKAFELDGNYLGGFFQLANVLTASNQVEAGIELVNTPRLAKILSPPELNLQKGIFYLNAGRPLDALTHLKQVLKVQPNDFSLHTVLYRAYSEAGNKPQMVLTLERLKRIDEGRVKREMPWAYKELGRLYEESMIFGNAIEAYEIYLGIVPEDSNAIEIQERIIDWRIQGYGRMQN
jgi:tetratricopeptide (TPR) repeat protein